MDINDSTGIQNLLEQLKSSQAWQDAIASAHPDSSQHIVDPPQFHPISVAALLSQLQPSPRPDVNASQNHLATLQHDASPSSFPISPPPVAQDYAPTSSFSISSHSLNFQQALALIVSHSADQKFSETLKNMKKEQDALESILSDERKAILLKYESRVQVAKTKASMIGSGISKHEANMLSDAFARELRLFDKERVLTAWDGLALQQQEAFAQMGVPMMFSATDVSERQKQKKIMQVLEGLF
ncbi:hypothetical protein J3R30DRAFT_3379713 [Lentinula aciculospora]|uniref:Uncharacterized protein n=1 Tax=Lentinula aciculospora TaxID=153920 RepID=A0A9W9DIE9_9AGAR|nr:hypothetical protein J3R30DRAFT_3379713 [Lentinula aciculospora]